MSSEVRPINPLNEVLARRQYYQGSLYKAAFTDARFSSGFGMYPPPTPKHPKTGGSIAWILVKFGFVGGLGIFLNQYVLFVLTGLYGLYFLISAILSSQAAVLVNFALNNFLVFRSRETAGGLVRKALLFNAVSSSDLLVRIPLLWGLTSAIGIPYLWSNLASIFATFGGRFLFSEKKIWAKRPESK
ncbi:MAG TPA: GtrA family protein [Candidatus Bathyarchaeia archaeon]|nr:GtrA family protein [Candidatus Bathyarchaeia archaeon]